MGRSGEESFETVNSFLPNPEHSGGMIYQARHKSWRSLRGETAAVKLSYGLASKCLIQSSNISV